MNGRNIFFKHENKQHSNFPIKKSIGGVAFYGNLATGHFSVKLVFKMAGSDHTGSNDTGFKFM